MKRTLLATVFLALAATAPAFGQSVTVPAELMAPVTAWANAFNAGQVAFPADAFTPDGTVIDEFPPFEWGETGSQDSVRSWYDRLVGANDPQRRARFLASHQRVSFDAASYVRVKGDGAYIVFPATLTYIADGKDHVQKGTYVVVEVKTPSGWRISANSWAVDSDD